MVNITDPVISRVMVKRVRVSPITDTIRDRFMGTTSYGQFTSFYIGDKIRDFLGVKPTAALSVSYRNDPFNLQNNQRTNHLHNHLHSRQPNHPANPLPNQLPKSSSSSAGTENPALAATKRGA